MFNVSDTKIKSCFEHKVLEGLKNCGLNLESLKEDKKVIGAAVSGGADSISLLYSLCFVLKPFSIPLEVITVNHYIRPDEETCGDVNFVVETVEKLKNEGFNVSCTVSEIKKGKVLELARERKNGIEEAARIVRYNAFKEFINDKNISYLCLAHNKNDQEETLIMRFLQGSTIDSCGGINSTREKYIRPLLNISRSDIEEYCKCLNTSWCEDKTNSDTQYFRNNIRHNLIPLLDKYFKGWDKAVISGGRKAREDSKIIQSLVDDFSFISCDENHVKLNKEDFIKEPLPIQKRILLKACNNLGVTYRVTDAFLEDVINCAIIDTGKEITKRFSNICITISKDYIQIDTYEKKDTDLVFFDIIDEDGVYDFPFGSLSVTFEEGRVFASINGCETILNCCYPIAIRNLKQGDFIASGKGQLKKVSDILSDWHVDIKYRKMIPVIYELKRGEKKLLALLSSFLGYKDWVVK